jgi:hypothetical protein
LNTKTKVLEITTKQSDFVEGNKLATGKDLIESAGLYLKKQGDFDLDIDQNSFMSFIGAEKEGTRRKVLLLLLLFWYY